MDSIKAWGQRHNISDAAMLELNDMFNYTMEPKDVKLTAKFTEAPMTEADIQAHIRLAGTNRGWRLWRNNVGVAIDSRGVPVRYGLCNETKAMNKRIKSSDLIGIRPIIIGQHNVGKIIGQFVAYEVKDSKWTFKGNEHETAQLRFQNIVRNLGGHAQFINNPEDLR